MHDPDIRFCEFGEMSDTQYTEIKKNQGVKYRSHMKGTQAVKYNHANKANKKDWMLMSEHFCDAYYGEDID
ncbi:hypothetical protein HZI73_10510 [Vallitalea pronyensis]|uniref:Uncharacterized protein n=1 Tax=Vallitalea pronyensis TaxID=1348613 RepID=A0A8J8MJF9_9FIRM|nr:hypothetical protein [Vallitalea pronyensis]QUI22699.1 hypothetical protein HZI73_10510 [Vallitalea pronyensis]